MYKGFRMLTVSMVSYCYMSTWVELYRMVKKAIYLWTDSYIALLGFLYSFVK